MRGVPRFKNDEERRLGKAQSSRDWHRVTRHEAWFRKHESPTRESSKAPPTLAELREAFLHRNDSCENMIRLGSMLEDIEAKYHVGYEFYSDHFEHETFYEVEYDAPWLTGIRGYIKTDPFLLSKYKPNPASLVFETEVEDWLVPIQKKAKELLRSSNGSFRALTRLIKDLNGV